MNSIYPTLQTRKPRSLAYELVEKLTADIHGGRLNAKQKLPTEADIVAAFGVSRTVVREAISKLQAAGLVETRHGIGTFVLAQTDTPFFRVDSNQLSTLHDVIALLELRISIETEAAALAALRRTNENLVVMQEATRAFLSAIELGKDAISADFQFHHEIARATQNSHFADMMKSLGSQSIPRARLEDVTGQEPMRLAYLRRVHQEHDSILNAIEAQDVESARAAMRTHLSNSRDRHKNANQAASNSDMKG
ncbi:MAG: FadR family transcriptional regulator [Comamonadaceae bacterium]|nr:MAG: FadR family transcriptional regulator [Comamonadaceae bacterium]